jgi:hypothetical protein
MALQITIKLTDEQEESLTRFWNQQSQPQTSPVDGQQMFVNPYVSVEDLIVQTVQATVVKTAIDRCPPTAAMKDLEDMQKLRDKMSARTKVELAPAK